MNIAAPCYISSLINLAIRDLNLAHLNIFLWGLFIAELNRQRSELWWDARERLKSLANRALDGVEM